ncbi:L-allo-threonine aldolase [uncultured delta proteobacterium]|uniref:L-allo-threonine aldolase n=1 Tax=uncultured delta proteobacterium TaxID=34034 RepID=A0A212JWD8_9DELT|nr:L-allo-threonine aldolase [uncultured delta proteobacterium]
MNIIDLRSDTVTQPTDAMREAMSRAVVGDDVYGDDPTVNELQALAADMLGKEAALFVPTGTMGNQASIMAQTRPGDEIIAAAGSHIFINEGGGAARLSGVSCMTAHNPDGKLTADDVHRLRRDPGNAHYPRTTLVCLENALGNGDVVTLDEMKAVRAAADTYNLRVHLDGARIFNAATALGVSARAIADCVDTVSCCLSKGLCAPVGSLICGPKDFIAEAHRCRKVLGGGMRQAGVLAACGILALTEMTKRLGEDHDNARLLGKLLAGIPGVTVDQAKIRINMVFWEPKIEGFNNQAFGAFMLERGFKISSPYAGPFRLVTHNGVTRADVERFAALFKDYVRGL